MISRAAPLPVSFALLIGLERGQSSIAMEACGYEFSAGHRLR